MTGIDIQKVFRAGPDVLTWYDMATTVADPVPVANWMQVSDRQDHPNQGGLRPPGPRGRLVTTARAGALAVAVLAGSQFLAVTSTTAASPRESRAEPAAEPPPACVVR